MLGEKTPIVFSRKHVDYILPLPRRESVGVRVTHQLHREVLRKMPNPIAANIGLNTSLKVFHV